MLALYKKWAEKFEEECLDECPATGIEEGMLQCFGCKRWYHTNCLAEKFDDEEHKYINWSDDYYFYCNINNYCIYNRQTEYFEKYQLEDYVPQAVPKKTKQKKNEEEKDKDVLLIDK